MMETDVDPLGPENVFFILFFLINVLNSNCIQNSLTIEMISASLVPCSYGLVSSLLKTSVLPVLCLQLRYQ